MILTSELRVEHKFVGQNTQHMLFSFGQFFRACHKKISSPLLELSTGWINYGVSFDIEK